MVDPTATRVPSSTDSDNNPAVNLAKVLADENDEIKRLCESRGVLADLQTTEHREGKVARFAVAFSGGGIRSAALNLGVIQALAKAGLLRQVHYMSGISGGGYILGWLTSWIRRSGFDDVEGQLSTGVQKQSSDSSNGGLLTGLLNGISRCLSKWNERNAPKGEQAHSATPAQENIYYRFLEPDPIRHLREYTSYLSPRMSLASGDTLSMLSIYLRNVLLNQTMMVSLLAGLIAITHLLAPWVMWKTPLPVWAVASFILLAIMTAVLAGIFTGTSLGRLAHNQKPREWANAGLNAAAMTTVMAACLWVLLPTALASRYPGVASVIPALLVLITYGVGWFCEPRVAGAEHLSAVTQKPGLTFLAILVAASFVSLAALGLEKWLSHGREIYVGDWYVMLGLPSILVILSVSSFVDIGIAGNAFPDAKREWLGRLVGYYLYFSVLIAVIMIGSLRGPLWMHMLFNDAAAAGGQGKWLKWLLPGGWVCTVVSGLLAAKSSKTGDSDTAKVLSLNTLAKIAPPVFLAGVFLLVSWVVHTITIRAGAPEYLTWVRVSDNRSPQSLLLAEVHGAGSMSVIYQRAREHGATQPKTLLQLRGACITSTNCQSDGQVWGVAQAAEDHLHRWSIVCALFLVAGVALLVSSVLMARLDANEFSMHLFYRNRLVRAFLGASNVRSKSANTGGRIPSPFTGFALDDDVPLQEMSSNWPRCRHTYDDSDVSGGPCYDGPYPVWGTALNLTAGEDLAWQERKAASFIYSPLYCGWDYAPQHLEPSERPSEKQDSADDVGDFAYRGTGGVTRDDDQRTPYTGARGGPSVGTAMAASGAAVSPNWGYHTTPAVAALLALFNVRIGWWTGNPRRRDCWKTYAPGADYLITKELFGEADDSAPYVYLSDGGHFDNLGIYEMVRRRIKYIIACDADADPHYEFGDLANTVEKCRRDFGVNIDIDPSPIRPKTKADLSQRHFAVGSINYPSVPSNSQKAEKGILLYVKSSLTGSEPADVLGQRNRGSDFPHDATVNQFFNETQFEAYRALGENMLTGIWDDFIKNGKHTHIDEPRLARLCQDQPAFERSVFMAQLAGTVVDLFKYLEHTYEVARQRQ